MSPKLRIHKWSFAKTLAAKQGILSGHSCETTNGCQKICECDLKLHRKLQNQVCLPNKEYLIGHRCERITMAAKVKYLWMSVNTS